MGSHGTGQFSVVNRSTCIDSKYRGQPQRLSSCYPLRPVVDQMTGIFVHLGAVAGLVPRLRKVPRDVAPDLNYGAHVAVWPTAHT
jgi:hypothetical protein